MATNPVVTIDGCKLACATKMVQESGGQVARDSRYWMFIATTANSNHEGLLSLMKVAAAGSGPGRGNRYSCRRCNRSQPRRRSDALTAQEESRHRGLLRGRTPEGTVTRLAALKVLRELRPSDTVTICLPLFLAGGEGDRAFARFYPTIALDGCEERCHGATTEMYSGSPAASFCGE